MVGHVACILGEVCWHMRSWQHPLYSWEHWMKTTQTTGTVNVETGVFYSIGCPTSHPPRYLAKMPVAIKWEECNRRSMIWKNSWRSFGKELVSVFLWTLQLSYFTVQSDVHHRPTRQGAGANDDMFNPTLNASVRGVWRMILWSSQTYSQWSQERQHVRGHVILFLLNSFE